MNIIVDSTFNPFSYKDLMQPLYDYREAYKETEAEFTDLVTQTEAWKDIANRENSPEAYAMYKSYSDQLNAIVDDFSQGMNPRNRRQLIGMKKRYASEITPIAKASEAMNAANAFRDQAGPDAIFEEGRYSSIDRFLHGQTANNKFESRKDLVTRTAAMAQAVAQSIFEDPIIRQSMSPQFLEVIQKKGLGSLADLQQAIAGNAIASNRFAQLKRSLIDSIGGLDRFDDAGRAAINGALNEGLYAGLNNYQVQLQQNGEYINAAQRVANAQNAARIALDKEKWNYTRDVTEGRRAVGVRADGSEIYTNPLGEVSIRTPQTHLVNGKVYYEYRTADGLRYWGDSPYETKDDKGNKITLQFNNPEYSATLTKAYKENQKKSKSTSNSSSESSAKVGNVLGWTNVRLPSNNKPNTAVFDQGTGAKVYSKDDLVGATEVNPLDLTRAEEIIRDTYIQDNPEIDVNKLRFYRQWVNPAGIPCLKTTEGAKQVFLITDKK